MAAIYPNEPFAQAESLLTGLIDNYRSSSDPSDIADIRNLVETAVKIAREREFRVQDSIKGTEALLLSLRCCCCLSAASLIHLHDFAELTQKVVSAEADAEYGEARSQHEQRMKEMHGVIGGVQQEVQQLNNDLR
jgi:hypothetical protein